MYFELEDADLALLMSRERRGGQVAIWSLVVIFLVPGLLDGSIALVTLGGALAVGATTATVRAFRRHVQPGAAARGLHHPLPHRLPPYRPCALPERGTGARWVTTARPSRRPSRPRPRGACARQ